MSKYAILTLNDPLNYGNRLQNFALSKVLRAYGTTSTIKVRRCSYSTKSLMKRRVKDAFYSFKPIIKNESASHIPAAIKRVQRFRAFETRYLGKAEYELSGLLGLVGRQEEIETLVIGSDQVWNYTFLMDQRDLDLMLGNFPGKMRRISYAASIGVSNISDGVRDQFIKGLAGLQSISVREIQGADAIECVTGQRPATVLDPTLLLSSADWRSVGEGNLDNKPFILTYFLGRTTPQVDKHIQCLAKGLGIGVRRLNDTKDLNTYASGPQDFVELISQATCVFTDSFHACCFSILFNKPFFVFGRNGFEGAASMNSRMQTLFNHVGIINLPDDFEGYQNFDWDGVNQRIGDARLQSLSWIDEAV